MSTAEDIALAKARLNPTETRETHVPVQLGNKEEYHLPAMCSSHVTARYRQWKREAPDREYIRMTKKLEGYLVCESCIRVVENMPGWEAFSTKSAEDMATHKLQKHGIERGHLA